MTSVHVQCERPSQTGSSRRTCRIQRIPATRRRRTRLTRSAALNDVGGIQVSEITWSVGTERGLVSCSSPVLTHPHTESMRCAPLPAPRLTSNILIVLLLYDLGLDGLGLGLSLGPEDTTDATVSTRLSQRLGRAVTHFLASTTSGTSSSAARLVGELMGAASVMLFRVGGELDGSGRLKRGAATGIARVSVVDTMVYWRGGSTYIYDTKR